MDEGKVTGLLFVDISKTFDPLNHKVLLRKLERLGLSERSLRWFRSHLADRQQSVLIKRPFYRHAVCIGSMLHVNLLRKDELMTDDICSADADAVAMGTLSPLTRKRGSV